MHRIVESARNHAKAGMRMRLEQCEIPAVRSGEPLPPSLIGNRQDLSKAGTLEIVEMMRPAPGRFLLQLAGAWLAIAATIAAAEYFHSIWLTVLAILVIGTRQNILGLLMHEQCHCLGFKSKRGTALANLTAAYP